MICLWTSYKKKIGKKYFFASLKSMKNDVEFGVGSGSICQRYGSSDPDLVPHHNVPNTGSKDKEWGVLSTTLCSSDMF
jgi:hypothetical protein